MKTPDKAAPILEKLREYDLDDSNANALFWAQRYRMIREGNELVPFSIDKPPRLYPFLRPIYYNRRPHGPSRIIFKKPVRIGATEFAFNSALYAIDVFKVNVGYMLPGKAELNDLAGARIDRIIQESPHIRSLFDNIDNAGLKSGRSGSLYFRGANSATGLEEFGVSYMIRDELDRMNQENAALALERLGGSSSIKWRLDLGHPISPDRGIDLEFQNSSMHEWYFECPHCHAEQHDVTSLDHFKSIVDFKNERLVCTECGKELQKSDLLNGYYKAEHPNNPRKGYHMTQLLSPTVTLGEIIEKYNDATGIPYLMGLFHHSVLGLAYSESSRRLTEKDVRKLMKGGPPMASYGQDTYIGIDVGERGLHVWIQDEESVLRVMVVGLWEELDPIMEQFKPKTVIIDAGPEGHAARAYVLGLRAKGIEAWLCRRSGQKEGKRSVDERTFTITTNVTEQFDRFFSGLSNLQLPIDFPKDAIAHLCSPVRVLLEGPGGITRGRYSKGVAHYCDAGAYASEANPNLIPKQHIIPAIKPPLAEFLKTSNWKGRFRGD